MKTKVLMLIISLLVIGGGFLAMHLWNKDQEQKMNPDQELQTAIPSEGTVVVSITVPGVVEPVRSSSIRSSIPGTIISLTPVGTRVEAGQTIAILDPGSAQRALLQANIQALESAVNLERAESVLIRAERTLNGVITLHTAGDASSEQVQNARDSLVTADQNFRLSQLSQQKAQLAVEGAQNDLENTIVRAAFSGTIMSLTVSEGDGATTNGVLGVLADLSKIRFVAEIDEFDVVRIEPGLPVRITTDGSQAQNLNTNLEQISPSARIVNNISVFTISAIADNANGILRPGMTADLSIILQRDQGLIIPSRSVSTVRGRSYVDILDKDEPETIRIEIGADDGTNVVVLSGLEESSIVILPPVAPLPSFLPASSLSTTTGTSIIPVSVPGSGGGSGSGSR